ncbi:MAG: radical SAM protein [Acidobacteriota bacterium]
MAICLNCRRESPIISEYLKLCLDCIRNNFERVKPLIDRAHSESRKKFNLPPFPPKKEGGKKCKVCVNQCIFSKDESGYCGSLELGTLDYYYDPLPTNCVADKVCEGTKKFGMKNLAVFYRSCSFNCLFCQNWHFKNSRYRTKTIPSEEFKNLIDKNTFCVCYFGGDPTPQIVHSIRASREILKNKKATICWETNGSMNSKIARKIAEISWSSNGWIKFDIKTFDTKLNYALCGTNNEWTLENFSMLAELKKEYGLKKGLIASTLLIPGYIDEEEIYKISKFISDLDRDIPYVLLGFSPHFFFYDLLRSSRMQAFKAKEIAEKNGLKNVYLGNVFLLS